MSDGTFRTAIYEGLIGVLGRLDSASEQRVRDTSEVDRLLNALIAEEQKQTALLEQIVAALAPKAPPPKRAPGKQMTQGSLTWEGYSRAYEERYTVPPVRNAKTNALCAQLSQRLGDEAWDVARFYVLQHNDRLYLNARHALELLVRDAEKIRTDWKRGLALTSKDATNEESLSVARNQMEQIAKGEL